MKTKKPLDEDFHRAVTNCLGKRLPSVVARDADLPYQSISRVLDGVDPQLSRAIEVARALGFEIRYDWPLDSEARRLAVQLAIRSVRLFGPRQFREILAMKDADALLEHFAASLANYAHELGPTRTDEPDETYGQILRVLDWHEEAGAGRHDDDA